MSATGLKEPVQKRSQDSLDRLLRAGAKLLKERGYTGFTIPELSRRAKVSPGLIYGRFENKDALFRAIQDRELGRITREFDAITDPDRWAGRPLVSLLEEFIPQAAAFIESQAAIFSAFLIRGAADDAVQARGIEFMSALNARMLDLLLTRRDEISRPDPVRAAALACEILVAAFVRHSRGGTALPEPSFGLTRDEAMAELPVVCRAYLTN